MSWVGRTMCRPCCRSSCESAVMSGCFHRSVSPVTPQVKSLESLSSRPIRVLADVSSSLLLICSTQWRRSQFPCFALVCSALASPHFPGVSFRGSSGSVPNPEECYGSIEHISRQPVHMLRGWKVRPGLQPFVCCLSLSAGSLISDIRSLGERLQVGSFCRLSVSDSASLSLKSSCHVSAYRFSAWNRPVVVSMADAKTSGSGTIHGFYTAEQFAPRSFVNPTDDQVFVYWITLTKRVASSEFSRTCALGSLLASAE